MPKQSEKKKHSASTHSWTSAEREAVKAFKGIKRSEVVAKRSQVENPKTGKFVKRDADSGKFVEKKIKKAVKDYFRA